MPASAIPPCPHSIAVYGGFGDTETDRSQRNWKTNVTLLSSDLKQDDGPTFANNTDNAIVACTNIFKNHQ